MNLPQFREHLTYTLSFLVSVEPFLLGAAVVRGAQDRMARFAAKLRAGMDAEQTTQEQHKFSGGNVVPFAPRGRQQPTVGQPGRAAARTPSGTAKMEAHLSNILIREPADVDRSMPLRVVEPSAIELRQSQPRKRRMLAARDLPRLPDGAFVRTAGRVIARQKPEPASGFVSLSIEDETGISNILVPPDLYEKVQVLAAGGRFVQVAGRLQNEGGLVHIRASRIRVFDAAHTPSRSLDSL